MSWRRLQGLVATAAPAGEGQPNPLVQLIPFALIFVVFYALVFAPMRRKQKKHGEMLRQLKAGDRVVTNGGIYGTVVGVSDHVVQLRIADQVKIDIEKGAVASLQQQES
jgi:preprotein translocase subunit YajC